MDPVTIGFIGVGALVLLVALFLAACSVSDTLEVATPQAEPSKYAAIVVDARIKHVSQDI